MKDVKPTPGEATTGDGKRKAAERRSGTRQGVRRILERHRETFNQLAK